MNRIDEMRVIAFCCEQRKAFDAARWRELPCPTREEAATVALFLAGVDWYGHRPELFAVAESFAPGCTGQFARMVKKTRFDCSRFSSMLRKRLEHDNETPIR